MDNIQVTIDPQSAEDVARVLGKSVTEGAAIWGIQQFLENYGKLPAKVRLFNLGQLQKTIRAAKRRIKKRAKQLE